VLYEWIKMNCIKLGDAIEVSTNTKNKLVKCALKIYAADLEQK